MQYKIPCTIMRGGTSKGVFFKAQDLPADVERQDRVILAAFGSPDQYGRQLDGLGGATSTTSKVAIIGSKPDEPNTVNYTFGQVGITTPLVDRRGNCGNICSAVGPFAIDEGMVTPISPATSVRIYNTNTKKYIIAHVSVEGGKARAEGDYRIAGVPGPGACLSLEFDRPGGAVTGKLLPTGRARDILETSRGPIEVSIVDASNPVVFVRARDLFLSGSELPAFVNSDAELLARIEDIRAAGAVAIGVANSPAQATRDSPAIPKIAFVSSPTEYMMTFGVKMAADDVDLVARIMSMGRLHSEYAITGAICTAGAALIDGTVVHEVLGPNRRSETEIRLGHPSGSIAVMAKMQADGGGLEYASATVLRTARRILDGFVYVSDSPFDRRQ